MKREATILLMIMSAFSILNIVINTDDIGVMINNIVLIIVLCLIQLLKELVKLKKMHLSTLQIILVIVSVCLNFGGFEYVLPTILFDIIGRKVKLLSFIAISIVSSFILARDNYSVIILINILLPLYLYEVSRQSINNKKLKESNRDQRYEKDLLEKKMINLEKYLDQYNIMASLKERNFIAQKLHDHLGHRITSSIMQLEVTKETIGKDNELSIKYLESAMTNLREGMDEIRIVLRNVKPKNNMLGIEDIKEQLLKFQYETGIKTTLHIEGDISKIELNIWMILEDNIKEALTNVGKHSKASEVNISVYIYNKIARIEVRDNGIGCNNLNKGLGFQGIEERIYSINGRVEYFNDNGFVVNMIINLGD